MHNDKSWLSFIYLLICFKIGSLVLQVQYLKDNLLAKLFLLIIKYTWLLVNFSMSSDEPKAKY